MSKKTCRGYSLAETLISLFLISLLIVAYTNLVSLVNTHYTKNYLISNLFNDASSLVSIMEDKSFELMPLELFDISNPLPFAFLATKLHTAEMTLTHFATHFDIVIPEQLATSNYSLVCSYSSFFLDDIEFHQIHLYLLQRYHQTILYGYASLVI